MPAHYKREIEQFVSYFQREADELKRGMTPLHRKILYATALDTLARAAYGGNIGNRARMTRLIRELSGWTHADRVSLPQLRLRLRANNRYRYRLYREVQGRLSLWGLDGDVGLERSPLASELLPFAQADEDKAIAKCQYFELFYAYRNALVHEFREPGYGWDISGSGKRPYYMSYLNAEGEWELVFPSGFFQGLYAEALANLCAHLTKHKMNPYGQFQFGSMWR